MRSMHHFAVGVKLNKYLFADDFDAAVISLTWWTSPPQKRGKNVIDTLLEMESVSHKIPYLMQLCMDFYVMMVLQ